MSLPCYTFLVMSSGIGTTRTRRVAELREWLGRVDPELLEAAAEVDRELLQWMLSLTPLQRIAAATQAAIELSDFTHVSSRPG